MPPADDRDANVSGPDPEVQRGIRGYYRTVSRFIDRETDERRDRPLWAGIAAEHAGEEALDLGCGTGGVTALLAEHLGRVVGVDLSMPMLTRARRRLGGRAASSGGRAVLVAADMRRMGFAHRFDLITAANDPFAHLSAAEDRDRALRAAAAHLAPEGRFVLDAHWFPPDLLERALGADGLEREHAGEGLAVRERWWCTADGRCRARYEYRRGDTILGSAEFLAHYWTVGEVRRRFDRAGLAVTALWGGYDRTPWDAASSRHLVVEAGRAGGRGRLG